MGSIASFLLIAVVAIGLFAVGIYNSLVSIRTQIKASIQEIGNQLKRQASLIPNLESATKSYLKHEKGIFKLLTDTRKSVNKASKSNSLKDIDKAIDKINTMVPKINVLVESNPQLKADTTVNKFMSELADTADKLSYARRSLIDLSQRFNQKIVVFPNNIIANIFGFKEEKGLGTPMSGSHTSVSNEETKDVKINLDN